MVSGTVFVCITSLYQVFSTPIISVQYNLTEAMAATSGCRGIDVFSGVIWRWRGVSSNVVLLH